MDAAYMAVHPSSVHRPHPTHSSVNGETAPNKTKRPIDSRLTLHNNAVLSAKYHLSTALAYHPRIVLGILHACTRRSETRTTITLIAITYVPQPSFAPNSFTLVELDLRHSSAPPEEKCLIKIS